MQISFDRAIFHINQNFNNVLDLRQIYFNIADKKACLIFLDGFIDKIVFEDHIFSPLKNIVHLSAPYYKTIKKFTCPTTSILCVDSIEDIVSNVEQGEICLLIEDAELYFIFSEKSFSTRAVQEPPVNNVIRGPREGFNEDIKTNMTLIRKRLFTKNLKFEMQVVGKQTKTKVVVAYLESIANEKIKNEIVEKIKKIDIDGIIESSYISRFIEDNKKSLFNQVGTSEKPDVVVAKLLEGRIAIIVDGSPTVLTLPFILLEEFQSAEDYYVKSYRATLVRLIRVLAVLMAILLPGFYVAFQEFQYHLLPIRFLQSIIKAQETIPLTPTIEMLVVTIIFEILSEASIRMPRYISMALSVVGAIVLGETAVGAGLLSTPTILVIAISTLGMFCVPGETNASSVLRMVGILSGGLLGVYGMVLFTIVLIGYLASLNNYQSSYLSPYAPIILNDWKDGFIKDDLLDMKERPYSIKTSNRTRLK